MKLKSNFYIGDWLLCTLIVIWIGTTAAYFPGKRTAKAGGGIILTEVGTDSVSISFSGRLSYVNTSVSSLTLGDTTLYTFSGVTTTWTLPPVATYGGKFYIIKNKGTGNITINSNAGGNDIFDDVATNTLSMLPGETFTIFNDGVHWCTKP